MTVEALEDVDTGRVIAHQAAADLGVRIKRTSKAFSDLQVQGEILRSLS